MHKKIDDIKVNKTTISNIFSKKNIIYFIIFILDMGLVIYFARKNVVNCVVISDKTIVVGGNNRLLFGKNYITLVVTFFFYVYICLINKVIFKEKKNEIFYVLLFLVLILLNIGLFYLFTKRVY